MSKIQLLPDRFIHVLNRNTNTTFVVKGPTNFVPSEHQEVVYGPADCVRLAPDSFARVKNPVVQGQDLEDTETQVKLRHGETEIRFADPESEPFPLYPGELLMEVEKIPVVGTGQAAHIVVTDDYEDETEGSRYAGEEYMVFGPCSYKPRIEEYLYRIVNPIVIGHNMALRVRARTNCVDWKGNQRVQGELWLIKEDGDYIPRAMEEVVDFVHATTLTDSKAIHVEALTGFHDTLFEIDRRPGEQWLVTNEHTATYLPDVTERIIKHVDITVLTSEQWCVIMEPYDESKREVRLGQRELRKGPCRFFLHPSESLEGGSARDVRLLEPGEAALLGSNAAVSVEDLADMGIETEEPYEAGRVWMVYGPRRFVPPVDVEVIEYRSTIPLGDNEGVYVRDVRTGEVRAEMGNSYLLQSHEVLWEKPLTPRVEELLRNGGAVGDQDIRKVSYFKSYIDGNNEGERDKTRVVVYKCPHNCAVQLYDYQERTARVVFGPDLVTLGPHEEFTVLSLSAGVPKRSGALKSLALMLGPDYISDVFDVETSDHARLRLHLAYNNYFRVDKEDPEQVSRIFNIPDFIGDACKTCSSLIRGAIAKESFEDFHKNSAHIIRASLFGLTAENKIGDEFVFEQNNLVITNVDIRAIDPVDRNMQESLQRSVQMAIDISTSLLEAESHHKAAEVNQKSMGELEMQKYRNGIEEERERTQLKKIVAANNEVEKVGRARTETEAATIAVTLDLEGAVTLAALRAEAKKKVFDAELSILKAKSKQEESFQKNSMELEVQRERELANVEVTKLESMCSIIGKETVLDIARANAETKTKLVDGLGLRDFLMADGKMPVNLFGTIEALLGEAASEGKAPAIEYEYEYEYE